MLASRSTTLSFLPRYLSTDKPALFEYNIFPQATATPWWGITLLGSIALQNQVIIITHKETWNLQCKQATAISSKLKTPQVGIPCSKQLNRLGTSQIAWCQVELDRSHRYSRRLVARALISPPVLSTARLGLSPVINCGLSKSCKGAQKSKETLLVRKTHLNLKQTRLN